MKSEAFRYDKSFEHSPNLQNIHAIYAGHQNEPGLLTVVIDADGNNDLSSYREWLHPDGVGVASMPASVLLQVLEELANTLNYLHELSVAHLNVSMDNVTVAGVRSPPYFPPSPSRSAASCADAKDAQALLVLTCAHL